jgi:transcription elongation factor Elf1
MWFNNFNPQDYIARVDVSKYLVSNNPDNESYIKNKEFVCFLCSKSYEEGVQLNDKSFVCSKCVAIVSQTRYPQKYETSLKEYYIKKESRNIAFTDLIKNNKYNKVISVLVKAIIMITLISIIIIAFRIYAASFLLFPLSLLIVYLLQAIFTTKNKRTDFIAYWNNSYPEPDPPILRNFYDPESELNDYDRLVLRVFNHWPGLPPYWDYIKSIVFKRDNYRCQVTGCPSRTRIQVHHIKPKSQGGPHTIENLVTLCAFHHALEPDTGHLRLWTNIMTEYFTIVREFERKYIKSQGTYTVKQFVRRIKNITLTDLSSLLTYFGMKCPICLSDKSLICYADEKKAFVICEVCKIEWSFTKGLVEENGPALAKVLCVSKNIGSWEPDMSLYRDRCEFAVKNIDLKITRDKIKKEKQKLDNTPKCPRCGSPMKLIKPHKYEYWKPFWGCSKYNTTLRCNGKLRYIYKRK